MNVISIVFIILYALMGIFIINGIWMFFRIDKYINVMQKSASNRKFDLRSELARRIKKHKFRLLTNTPITIIGLLLIYKIEYFDNIASFWLKGIFGFFFLGIPLEFEYYMFFKTSLKRLNKKS